MTDRSIILLGDFSEDRQTLDSVASEFGWSLESIPDLNSWHTINPDRRVAAILFDAKTFGLSWKFAVRTVLEAAPEALPIVCYRFSEKIDWPELASAGAFHALVLPFDESEVRQSLGFVWAACQRASKDLFLCPPKPQKAATQIARGRARAAGFVA
jgi:hypothetical protein